MGNTNVDNNIHLWSINFAGRYFTPINQPTIKTCEVGLVPPNWGSERLLDLFKVGPRCSCKYICFSFLSFSASPFLLPAMDIACCKDPLVTIVDDLCPQEAHHLIKGFPASAGWRADRLRLLRAVPRRPGSSPHSVQTLPLNWTQDDNQDLDWSTSPKGSNPQAEF